MARIRDAWADVEWRSIIDGVRPCALVGLSQSQLAATVPQWSTQRLSAHGLPIQQSGLVFAVVGRPAEVARARDAWAAREDETLGLLFGYPDCCRSFFAKVWVDQKSIDTTWAMAANTVQCKDPLIAVEAGMNLANILWRWMGVRAVPHLPCRFDCAQSIALGEQLLGVAGRAGRAEEVEWVREILSWPVEWSALHGIAEIKTPILKVATRTDATARKYVVRWMGGGYPQEGATGLRFPFKSSKRPLLTEGRSYQSGLQRPDWYHLDNGFNSLDAMNELHRPIVALARGTLAGKSGNVLDLGCGNGALLSRICDGALVPYGVDKNTGALAHAAALLPHFAGNFVAGDLFECPMWERRYALAVLMAGRLLEVERPVAERLLQRLRKQADAVLVYVYPGGPHASLASVARQLRFMLADPNAETASLLADTDGIDWGRLAEPQTDQYDTDVILRLASTTVSASRPQPYRRAPVGDSPTLFDGQVAVRPVYHSVPEFVPFAEHYRDAPADHPNLRAAAELVRQWPAAFAQCQRLIESIHPALDLRVPLDGVDGYRGSSCHSYEQLFGTLWSTIYCPIGLAEAIVHELAHQKLRVLGVSFESATAIVANHPSRLYVSPIIKDRERPMSAVLHAQYSYVHVAALDVHMLHAECDPTRREILSQVLARNLARIEEGYETLRRNFEPGVHGREFMEGLTRWTEATMAAARELLGRTVEPMPEIETAAASIVMPDRTIEVLLSLASPRIVLLGNVLSDEECDTLIAYCERHLTRTPVVADAEGNVQVHENRTSLGVGLRLRETELIARIEARLASLAQWPAARAEGLQVLRYDTAQEYRPHFDWMDPNLPGLRQHLGNGGQRLATFLLYLSNVESGGETAFPELGLEIKPRKGAALFFANTDSRRAPDHRTLHAGRPVIKGVKLVANKWLRERAC